MNYNILENFFTHKDFLPDVSMIPGTLFTPMHFAVEIFLMLIIVSAAFYVGKRKQFIKPVFTWLWTALVVMEIAIITWESIAGEINHLNLQTSLSLYPCSIFMYILPILIWADDDSLMKKASYGYLYTLGLLGAAVNLMYPYRLTDYCVISFPALHSMIYHGAMFFAYLVVIISQEHTYFSAKRIEELFYPCIPTLILSIPANILNYSPLNSDYMYFKGYYPILQKMFPDVECIYITIGIYIMYIMVPALFYLPGYLYNMHQSGILVRDQIEENNKIWHSIASGKIVQTCIKTIKKIKGK